MLNTDLKFDFSLLTTTKQKKDQRSRAFYLNAIIIKQLWFRFKSKKYRNLLKINLEKGKYRGYL